MRDAFGGAFMIKIILVFLGVYIAFMAVALNYAKAFRVKNQIINYIEQFEGYNELTKEHIDEYVSNVRYYVKLNPNTMSNDSRTCVSNGYCVTLAGTTENKGVYYLVETFIRLELPFFGISITIPIRGETRVVLNT